MGRSKLCSSGVAAAMDGVVGAASRALEVEASAKQKNVQVLGAASPPPDPKRKQETAELEAHSSCCRPGGLYGFFIPISCPNEKLPFH